MDIKTINGRTKHLSAILARKRENPINPARRRCQGQRARGIASYLAVGYTQNAIDAAMGNTPTFGLTVEGALFNAGVAAALSVPVGKAFPVAENTMRTLRQANYFMPGRTVGILFTTQNARNMYLQSLISVGIGAYAGFKYAQWE